MHLISVSTVCTSPSSKNTWEPPMDFAYALVVTWSVIWILPAFKASKIRSSVITLVTLAGLRFSSASFSNNSFPVDASIKTAEGACMETACACPETTADTGISGSIPYTTIPVILHHRT